MRTVSVLLSTYNGEKFLSEQLQSLCNQENIKLKIFIRDDGSTDNTISILKKYQSEYNNIYVTYGNNIGYKKSFMELIKISENSADYYAFCDQDDYWEKEKMSRAVTILDENSSSGDICLYFSSLNIADVDLNIIGVKKYQEFNKTLGSAMSRFNISGCTMVFNNMLANELIKKKFVDYCFGGHDAWIYKVCLCLNGKIFMDNKSFIRYRQHGNNVTGVKQGIKKRVIREINLIKKNKNYNYNTAQILLDKISNENILNAKNEKILSKIVNYKNGFLPYIALVFDREIKTDNLILNLFTKVKMILRVY